MISAPLFLDDLEARGYGPFFGVPCSFLTPLIDCAIREHEYYAANNEGEAVAMAAGAWLGGRKPVVMFQNSGLGNAINPITSLLVPCAIPLLLLVTWRGEPGRPDEPQHARMGAVTAEMLHLAGVTVSDLPDVAEGLHACLVHHGDLEPYDARDAAPIAARGASQPATWRDGATVSRTTMLEAIRRAAGDALLIATTGKTGRELFTLGDSDRNLYVVGSMGCASSIGLGLALQEPKHRIIVLDGDGAALMRLEAIAGIGHHHPENLAHCILDNGVHDSTGGQATLSSTVDFPTVALACGYRSATSVANPDDAVAALDLPGPSLIHIRIRPGSPSRLGRPTVGPAEVVRRFRAAASGGS